MKNQENMFEFSFFDKKNPLNWFEFAILTGKIKKIYLKLWFNIKFCVFDKKNPVNWFEFAILTEKIKEIDFFENETNVQIS